MVEAALRSDPLLIRRLRELAEVRDLLAAMARPALPFDLSAAVVAKIAAHETQPWYSRPRLRWLQRTRLALAAVAAGLIALSLTLWIHSGRQPGFHPVRRSFLAKAIQPVPAPAPTES